jgi:hypothetical protein
LSERILHAASICWGGGIKQKASVQKSVVVITPTPNMSGRKIRNKNIAQILD